MGILIADLNYINLDDVNFDEDEPEAIIQVKLMPWRNRFKQRRAFKKINKQRINVCSMASNKMVGLPHARRWEEINKYFFGWRKKYKVVSIVSTKLNALLNDDTVTKQIRQAADYIWNY